MATNSHQFARCPPAPQVEQAQQELERRQAAAEAQAEELAARERSLRRQEDGLEGLKVRQAHCCACRRCAAFCWALLMLLALLALLVDCPQLSCAGKVA